MQPLADRPDAVARLRGRGIEATPLTSGPFPMWLVTMRQGPDAALLDLLSDAERTRAARFRTQALSGRYVAAHAALRLLGEWHFGIPASRQCYDSDARGKPRLAGAAAASCNISYSGRHALIGLAGGAEIGVDVETVRSIDDASGLMALHYTRGEQAALQRISLAGAAGSKAFDRAFLTVWVRKEACVKALGCGLSMPLTMLECGADDRMTTVQAGDRQIRTGVIHAPGDHVIAWALCC